MGNNYFGIPAVDTCDCRPEVAAYPFYASNDVDGTCRFDLLDLVDFADYLYNFGRVGEIGFCPSCPPTKGWDNTIASRYEIKPIPMMKPDDRIPNSSQKDIK